MPFHVSCFSFLSRGQCKSRAHRVQWQSVLLIVDTTQVNILAVSGDIVVRFVSGSLVDKWGARILIGGVLMASADASTESGGDPSKAIVDAS